eukprot:1176196-Prorocentrum_minimum.AAC.2
MPRQSVIAVRPTRCSEQRCHHPDTQYKSIPDTNRYPIQIAVIAGRFTFGCTRLKMGKLAAGALACARLAEASPVVVSVASV